MTMDDLRYRPFKADDLSRLHEIRQAAFAPIFSSFRSLLGEQISGVALATAEREQADYLDTICAHDSKHDVFVIEVADEIVGFCSLSLDPETKLGEIDLNAVHPDHQGKGYGGHMFEAALDRMRSKGMKAATVGTGGDQSHAPARRAYEKAGFSKAIPNVYLYRSL